MTGPGPTPIFVDTGAFYARADENDKHHETATWLFNTIRSGDVAYRPIFTSQSVLAEFATLSLYKLGHSDAVRALSAIRDSESINVVPVGRATFETAAKQFEDYDDQEISFVDHTTSILANERDIEHIFAFDGDFRTLGFTLVPEDVGLADT
jgi:predicted nucleic acid-binding protein